MLAKTLKTTLLCVSVLLILEATAAQAGIKCQSKDLDFELNLSTKTCDVRYYTLEYPGGNDWGHPVYEYDYVTTWETNCEDTSTEGGYSYSFKLENAVSVTLNCDDEMKKCSGKVKFSDRTVFSSTRTEQIICN